MAATEKFLQRFDELRDTDEIKVAEAHAARAEVIAEKARERARRCYERILGEQVENVRSDSQYVGNIADALLHFYGNDIESELLYGLRPNRYIAESYQFEKLLEAAEVITDSDEPVPVLLSSPQETSYWEGGGHSDREWVLALVDPNEPFYSRFEIEKDVMMHAFTHEKADVIKRSFGFQGPAVTATTGIGESFGCIRSVSRQDAELIRLEGRSDGRGSGHGTYNYSGHHRNLIVSELNDPLYTIGWEALEELVLNESSTQKRIAAAQHIGLGILRLVENRAEKAPRILEIQRASKLLEWAVRG